MAVVPMQKVQLLVHQSDADAALAALQRTGAMEFRASEEVATPEVDFAYANLLPRAEHVSNFLKPYVPKRGMLQSLREGSQTELTEEGVVKVMSETESIEGIVEDIEKLQVEFAEKTDAVRILEDRHASLKRWETLSFKLSELETKTTVTKLIFLDQAVKPENSLTKQLEEALADVDFAHTVTEVGPCLAAVTVSKDTDEQALVSIIDVVNAEIADVLEGAEMPEIELTAVSEKLAAARGELALVHDQAEYFAKEHYNRLVVAIEILNWVKSRHDVLETARTTTRTALFTGWIDATAREAVETDFAEKKIAASLIDLEPEEGEEPPVEIRNHPLVAPFEAVTRLYGMPGYRDLDPTLFLAGFFFLFFGLSLTDVGYGAILAAFSAFLLFFCKIPTGMRLFAKLLLFVGISTMFVGALFGGYLGIAPESLPAPLRALQMFDPIGDPLPVFYLALSLGVLQVMVGLVLKIVSDAKNGDLLGGLLDQGPWLYMFCLGILYVLTAVGYVSLIGVEQIVNLAYVGIGLIVVTAARHGKGPFDMVMKAAGSLYGSIGYFADILSYSRLLALGLATTALAFAVNLIADIVRESVPYIGVVFALLILVIGHLFTLAVNTLGAFIHSARLQFVEFFGKFIAGTGKDFQPLSRTEEHVTVVKE